MFAMRISHKWAVALSGILWLAIGFLLLVRGLNILSSMEEVGNRPLVLVCTGLFLGFLKGRFVLSKTANKAVDRITSMHEPLPITAVFPLKYFLLIGIMMGVGILAKFLPDQARIVICVAVGSGLINGASQYLRFLVTKKVTSKS